MFLFLLHRELRNYNLQKRFFSSEYSKVCAVIDNNMPDEVFECCKNLIIFVRLSIDDKVSFVFTSWPVKITRCLKN